MALLDFAVTKMLAKLIYQVRQLKESRFVRNVAAVATGIAAAQAISLAFMPFLTRLYGPEAFGALASFTAVVNIISPLATLSFANGIVMPEADEDAMAVARLSLVCAAVVAPVVLVCVYLFQNQLAVWTGLEDASGLLYLIPLSLLLGAVLSVANQTAIREGLFKPKAGAHVASNLLMNLGKLAGGVFGPTGLLLILLWIAGKALNFILLLARVPRTGAFLVSRWFGTSGIRKAAWDQREFAIYNMPQSVLNASAIGLPVILLTAFSGSSAAGQYSVTALVLGAPVLLLGQSVGEVFYPKITLAIRERKVNALRLTIKATLALCSAALLPFGLVVLFGPDLFAFALGNEWRVAGEYSRWMAPWLASVLATRAILAAFPVLRLQSHMLMQEVISVAARSAALIAGLRYWQSDLVAVALFSLVGVSLMAALAVVGFWKLYKESRIWS